MLEAASRSLRTSAGSSSLRIGVAVASSKDKSINTAFSGPLSSIYVSALMRELCRSRVPDARLWGGARRASKRRRTYTQPTAQHDRSSGRILGGELQRTGPDQFGTRLVFEQQRAHFI